MANDTRSNPPPSVEIPPQNLAPSSPLDRVLREFGVEDATGIETGRIADALDSSFAGAAAQPDRLVVNTTYYARLVATALEITVTREESKALVDAGAKVVAFHTKS